jgi:hypothetical protein
MKGVEVVVFFKIWLGGKVIRNYKAEFDRV